MRNILKQVLQDWALFLALLLALEWTGAKFDWYHWLMILTAIIVYGIVSSRRSARYTKKHMTSLSAEEFDKWLESHGLSKDKVEDKR